MEPINLESSIILRTKGTRRKGRQSKGNLAEAKTGQHTPTLTLTGKGDEGSRKFVGKSWKYGLTGLTPPPRMFFSV